MAYYGFIFAQDLPDKLAPVGAGRVGFVDHARPLSQSVRRVGVERFAGQQVNRSICGVVQERMRVEIGYAADD